MHDALVINAPEGSFGLVNCPTSGSKMGPLLLNMLEHIKKNTCCSKEPIVVLLDSHKSHCTLDAILYCTENGIAMCTFPLHWTHQLQPLDVAMMGPFRTKLAQKQNSWLLNNAGQKFLIHNLPGIIRDVIDLSCTWGNIAAGLKETGVWPLDTTVCTDEDYKSSAMTDRPTTNNNLAVWWLSQQQPLPQQALPWC
jgi:hypothetical protein